MTQPTRPDLVTRTATSTASEVRVRGRDLVNELIGKCSFTQMLYFLTCHRMPEPAEVQVLDACLVTLMEHGLTPSAVIARLMADSVPEEPQVAIASGLLAIGSVFAGTTENCAMLLLALDERIRRGEADAAAAIARDYAAAKKPVPGFGHATHKPDDPRALRLMAFAAEVGKAQCYVPLLQSLSGAVDAAFGRHITVNATGAIGALLLEIGIPVQAMRAFSVVSRAGGLVGHLLEERETHSGREIWSAAKKTVPYTEDR
jgi:citrate synthase